VIATTVSIPAYGSTPALLIGPVDADYEVLITHNAGGVLFVSSDDTASSGCVFQFGTATIVPLKLKVGDSLYGAASEADSYGVFAQPC
jgi:hypothetical protein